VQVEAWALRFEPDRAGGDVLVATDGGRIVGFAALAVETEEVRAVYVHPDAGRLGTGARLLAALERIAGLRGLPAISLEASLNAVAFYAAAGWSRRRDTLRTFPGGCDVPCVAMTGAPRSDRRSAEAAADVDRIRAVAAAAFERPAGPAGRSSARRRRAAVYRRDARRRRREPSRCRPSRSAGSQDGPRARSMAISAPSVLRRRAGSSKRRSSGARARACGRRRPARHPVLPALRLRPGEPLQLRYPAPVRTRRSWRRARARGFADLAGDVGYRRFDAVE
jgi:hypothetical protein